MSFAVKYTDHMDYREYSDLVENPFVKASDWGWPVDPVGLRYSLNWMTTRWHKPLFIVENSLDAYDKLTDDHKVHDDYRIEYLRSHIKEMKKTVTEDGVDFAMGMHRLSKCINRRNEQALRFYLCWRR